MDTPRVSPREREVLALLGDHLTHEEIARRLFISVRTVESHVASLRRKLDLPDHRALVRHAASARREGGGPGTAGGLPVPPPTSFVGRAAELAALADAVRAARVVTAVGPGGVGKTRLALEAARALAGEFDEVRWVDLVPVGDPDRLADAVAQAFTAPVSSRIEPLDAVALAVGDRRVLLVLDNAEHLLDAAAGLAERLTGVCPRLHLLLTSRARLASAVERVVRVDGLGTDAGGDAVALFVERAVAAGSPPPPAGDIPRIAAVCTGLGGLALAIELAAVRSPVLGLDGVERGLVDQAGLLTGGSRVHARHRSMSATLDWSVALLDPRSARALRRLAVLVASFGPGDAVAVAAFAPLTADDVRSALAELAEHHLLTAVPDAGRMRYGMLEPVRQYALAGLDAADRPTREHHLTWCRGRIAGLLADEDAEDDAEARAGVDMVDAVDAVAPDARAALAWAAGRSAPAAAALARDLALLLYRDGRLAEAQLRFEQAAAAEPDDVAATADLARAAAVAKCRVLGEDALRLELASADRALTGGHPAAAACGLGRAVELLGRFPGMFARRPEPSASADLVRRARELAGDDPRAEATLAVATCGYASAEATTPADARAALEAARAVGDPALESSALDSLGAATLLAGDVVEAHAVVQHRLARVPGWRADPALGLELKDALHTAVIFALGAGDLPVAAAAAARQDDLAFLRERRDLADDELAAPAALAGDLALAVAVGESFLEDWTAAGRPPAAGRGLLPAAVALAHGLLGDDGERARWLGVLARIRGVQPDDVNRGSGYGELFEALVQLHAGRPRAALEALSDADGPGLYPSLFRQWIAAVRAEAAVLADASGVDAGADRMVDALLAQALERSRGNPVATGIAARAAALRRGDLAALPRLAGAFEAAGTGYQAERTRILAAAAASQ